MTATPLPLRRRLLMVAAATVAMLGSMLAFTSSASADGTDTTTDGPTYQMPSVGECHNIAWKNYFKMADTTPAIDCTTSHNSLVVATAQLPADTDWTRDSSDLNSAVTKTCEPAFRTTLGQSFRVDAKTAYSLSLYTPTKAQRDHGASWIRCDIDLPGNQTLHALRNNLLLTSTSIPRRLQSCLMVRPKTWAHVSCGSKHNWTLTRAFVVTGKAYPTRTRFVRFAASHCPTKNFWATWRAKFAWRAHDHSLVCYRPQG